VSSQRVQGAGSGIEHSPKWRALTVLAMGTDDWGVEQAASSLATAGHRILRCHEPGEPAFPCNALIPGRTCPLDEGFDVAVTVRARPLPHPTQSEFGVVCAPPNYFSPSVRSEMCDRLLTHPVAIAIHAEQHILAALIFIFRLFDRERRQTIIFANIQDRDPLGRAAE